MCSHTKATKACYFDASFDPACYNSSNTSGSNSRPDTNTLNCLPKHNVRPSQWGRNQNLSFNKFNKTSMQKLNMTWTSCNLSFKSSQIVHTYILHPAHRHFCNSFILTNTNTQFTEVSSQYLWRHTHTLHIQEGTDWLNQLCKAHGELPAD